jgi:hypothetical protein
MAKLQVHALAISKPCWKSALSLDWGMIPACAVVAIIVLLASMAQ